MKYNWQHPHWPYFTYDLAELQSLLYQYALEINDLWGNLSQLPEEVQGETLVDLMVSEAIKTSEIEGEKFDEEEVRSSIRTHLGISGKDMKKNLKDPRALGVGKFMVSLRQTFEAPLTEEILFRWHEMIMGAPPENPFMEVGKWRTDPQPMQIISGPFGHEKIHFEAPPASHVPREMKRFIQWFNETDPSFSSSPLSAPSLPGPVRSAIAHLYFESIHPFADGNGRMGRGLSEKALSQELKKPILFSLSSQIFRNKKEYYAHLSEASGNTLDLTSWIHYFLTILLKAQRDAKEVILFILKKTRFWKTYEMHLHERQQQVLRRMLQEGKEGFKGGIQATKYMKIASCSKATATRDLSFLLKLGCLKLLPGGGRSTRYELNLD